MNRSPLHSIHERNGAHWAPFAGWQLPLHFGSQLSEHRAVRSECGWFDVSHMGVVDVTGTEATAAMRLLLTNDVTRLDEPGAGLYTLMLNDQGGILDDLIIFRTSNGYRLIVNAATTADDLEWMRSRLDRFDFTIIHRTEYAMVAVQGPTARQTVGRLYPELDGELAALAPFQGFFQKEWFLSRTGYTGEDGLEIILPAEHAEALADTLSERRVQPCGLGARDSLRLEAGLNLYGQDMDSSVRPRACNLNWTVDTSDTDRQFVGSESLTEDESETQVGLILEQKGMMRHGYSVYSGEQAVGMVTSGGFSPTLNASIGLARINRDVLGPLSVDIRGRQLPAKRVKPPFVRNGRARVETGQ